MKICCIGRNYALHAKELNNPVPEEPVVFMKPVNALLENGQPFYYPNFSEEIHFEAEIVLKMAKNGRHIQPQFAPDYYDELTIGLDLTARDLQRRCKKQGLPWEIAKAFDGAAPVGRFVPVNDYADINALPFHLDKNKTTVQQGNTRDLLFSFDELIAYVSKFFTINQGDLLFTGTPAGVGPLQTGEVFEGFVEGEKLLECAVK